MVIKSVLLPRLRNVLSDIGFCLAHAGCLLVRGGSKHILLAPSAPLPLPFSQQTLTCQMKRGL